ncbi:MAG: 8-amino-7-oxononanoate synthase [Chitinophagaceae bacterium]|nr:8-amino-7-oxononanoate synthase [Chitinophagaceae bacterium]
MYPDDFLKHKLQARRDDHSLRSLRIVDGMVDFCSNDYLGLAKNGLLRHAHELASGSTGSRLLTGNSALAEETERMIAAFHQAESALLFNSGYDANLGLLSAVPQKGDTILYDQLSHASLRDGIRLSFAQSFSFLHNDLADLRKKLSGTTGNVFIVTESLFSMDGDLCPLADMLQLAESSGAHLIVDEAHATGVIGERGEGLVQQLQLQEKVFARVHTFGKACGCHGAVVLGSNELRDYLINFARSLVYTTALPPQAIAAIRRSYDVFPSMHNDREQLSRLIMQFQAAELAYSKAVSSTPIQAVFIPGNASARALAGRIREHGIDARAILYPTVPKGAERLRIILHSYNTPEELDSLIKLLQ